MSKQLTKDVAHANPGGPDNLPPNTSRHPITLENTPEKTIEIMQAFPERCSFSADGGPARGGLDYLSLEHADSMTVTNVRKVDRRSPKPSAEELSVPSRFERFAFHLVTVMNQSHWKRFWTWCQRGFG